VAAELERGHNSIKNLQKESTSVKQTLIGGLFNYYPYVRQQLKHLSIGQLEYKHRTKFGPGKT
jgi:hypothetical protein